MVFPFQYIGLYLKPCALNESFPIGNFGFIKIGDRLTYVNTLHTK